MTANHMINLACLCTRTHTQQYCVSHHFSVKVTHAVHTVNKRIEYTDIIKQNTFKNSYE